MGCSSSTVTKQQRYDKQMAPGDIYKKKERVIDSPDIETPEPTRETCKKSSSTTSLDCPSQLIDSSVASDAAAADGLQSQNEEERVNVEEPKPMDQNRENDEEHETAQESVYDSLDVVAVDPEASHVPQRDVSLQPDREPQHYAHETQEVDHCDVHHELDAETEVLQSEPESLVTLKKYFDTPADRRSSSVTRDLEGHQEQSELDTSAAHLHCKSCVTPASDDETNASEEDVLVVNNDTDASSEMCTKLFNTLSRLNERVGVSTNSSKWAFPYCYACPPSTEPKVFTGVPV